LPFRRWLYGTIQRVNSAIKGDTGRSDICQMPPLQLIVTWLPMLDPTSLADAKTEAAVIHRALIDAIVPTLKDGRS